MRIDSFTRNGLTFDVSDEGPLDGDPVVLLHGFPERATSWRRVAPLLHARGLRTLALDQRGYSPGARPSTRWGYRSSELVADVVELIDRVGRPVHLVGHDWGAVVGWLLAGRHPDLLRTFTAVSVPHPRAFLAAGLTSDQALRSTYVGFFQVPGVPEALAAKEGGLFDLALARSGMTEEEVDRFRREMVEDGALSGGLGWYRAAPLLDRGSTPRRVSVPTTMVWSDGDTAVARAGVDATARWCDGPYELVVLEGVTHWIPTQAPRPLADAVLARIASAA